MLLWSYCYTWHQSSDPNDTCIYSIIFLIFFLILNRVVKMCTHYFCTVILSMKEGLGVFISKGDTCRYLFMTGVHFKVRQLFLERKNEWHNFTVELKVYMRHSDIQAAKLWDICFICDVWHTFISGKSWRGSEFRLILSQPIQRTLPIQQYRYPSHIPGHFVILPLVMVSV